MLDNFIVAIKVFISYSSKDAPKAFKLHRALVNAGVPVWMDKVDIKPGQNWRKEIQRGLDESTAMVVVNSNDSFASSEVWNEWSYFLDEQKLIIPLVWEANTKLPYCLRPLQYIDFSQSFEAAFEDLLVALGYTPVPTPPAPVLIPKYNRWSLARNKNVPHSNEDDADIINRAPSDEKRRIFISFPHLDKSMYEGLGRTLTPVKLMGIQNGDAVNNAALSPDRLDYERQDNLWSTDIFLRLLESPDLAYDTTDPNTFDTSNDEQLGIPISSPILLKMEDIVERAYHQYESGGNMTEREKLKFSREYQTGTPINDQEDNLLSTPSKHQWETATLTEAPTITTTPTPLTSDRLRCNRRQHLRRLLRRHRQLLQPQQ